MHSRNLKIALLLLATTTIMSGVTIVASLPLISHTFSEIENIDFLSKLMLTIPSIVIALFAPFIGMVSDKMGRLKPLYLGLLLFIIGGSSGLYLDNFYLILVGRAVLGLGVAMIMTMSTALVTDYFDTHERHKFLASQGLAVGLGGILFISTGGFLAQIHWSYPFALYLLPLLFYPLLFKSLYEPKHHPRHEEITLEQEAKLLPVFVTAFFAMVLFYMLPTQLPYLIINELGGTPSSVGLLISTAMLANAFTAMQYAKIKARLHYDSIFLITFAFFGVGLLIVSHAQTIGDVYYSTVFMGVGFGLILTNVNAWFMSRVSSKARGKASGLLASSFFLGQFSSPLILEPLVLGHGIRGLFYIVALVSFGVSLLLLINKQIKRHTSPAKSK